LKGKVDGQSRGRCSKGRNGTGLEADIQRGERGETKGRHSKGRERGKLEAGVKRGGRGGNCRKHEDALTREQLRYFLKPDNVLFVQ